MHGICKPFQVNFHVLPLKKPSKHFSFCDTIFSSWGRSGRICYLPYCFNSKKKALLHGMWKLVGTRWNRLAMVCERKRWGGVLNFIKEHQSANLSLKNLLFCMEDRKNPIASRWQRQPPLKTNFYLSVLQMKSSSTCLITASLCEGPFFYFYVESPPSTFLHHLREHSCHSEFNVHSPKVYHWLIHDYGFACS
jgi:hypothetical protein